MENIFKLADGYKNWTAFVDEFRSIEESIQDSKKIERTLIQQCNRLKSELVISGIKLHTVMRVRAEDERTMALLRKECDRSNMAAMDAKRKENGALSLVSGLQADVQALQAQVTVLQSALWLERERANAAIKSAALSTSSSSSSKKTAKSRTKPSDTMRAAAGAAAGGGTTTPARSVTGIGSASTSFLGRRGVRGGRGSRPATTLAATSAAGCSSSGDKHGKNVGSLRRTGGSGGGPIVWAGSEFYDGGDYGGGNESDYWARGDGVFGEGSAAWSWGQGGVGPACGGGVDTLVPGLGGLGSKGRSLGRAGCEGNSPERTETGAITPFQRWKQERGDFLPGVAEVFRDRAG